MSLEITEEVIARQPAESQAIIRLLLVKIAELEARLQSFEEMFNRGCTAPSPFTESPAALLPKLTHTS